MKPFGLHQEEAPAYYYANVGPWPRRNSSGLPAEAIEDRNHGRSEDAPLKGYCN